SVPEIVEHAVTGFVVDNVDEAVAAVPLATALDRVVIRRRFEERFPVERMARDYVTLYETVRRHGAIDGALSSAAAAQAAAKAACGAGASRPGHTGPRGGR